MILVDQPDYAAPPAKAFVRIGHMRVRAEHLRTETYATSGAGLAHAASRYTEHPRLSWAQLAYDYALAEWSASSGEDRVDIAWEYVQIWARRVEIEERRAKRRTRRKSRAS